MQLTNELPKTDVNGEPVREHVTLLIQKTTVDDDDVLCKSFVCYSGKDRTEKKLLGISYLRLSADDSTTVCDGLHELHLHKVSASVTRTSFLHFRFNITCFAVP